MESNFESKTNSDIVSDMFYGALPVLFEHAKELRNKPIEAESFLNLKRLDISNIRFKRQHPV